jgi:hypothetical protein
LSMRIMMGVLPDLPAGVVRQPLTYIVPPNPILASSSLGSTDTLVSAPVILGN